PIAAQRLVVSVVQDERQGGCDEQYRRHAGHDGDRAPTLEPPSSRWRGRLRDGAEPLARIGSLGPYVDHPHGIVQSLEAYRPPVAVTNPFRPTGGMAGLLAGEDLRGAREAAQACSEVQRPAPVPAFDWHGLPCVQSDAHPQGE